MGEEGSVDAEDIARKTPTGHWMTEPEPSRGLTTTPEVDYRLISGELLATHIGIVFILYHGSKWMTLGRVAPTCIGFRTVPQDTTSVTAFDKVVRFCASLRITPF